MWRSSTTDEILRYYEQEFPEYISAIPNFITESKPKQIALALQEAYPAKGNIPPRDFIRRDTFETDDDGNPGKPQFTGWEGNQSIQQFIKSPADDDPLSGPARLVSPEVEGRPAVAEAVYFSLDFWDRNWVLGVDIDAKDVALDNARAEITSSNLSDGELREKFGIKQADPVGYPYRFQDIADALEYGFTTARWFEDALGANQTLVVYSGQGCHVYLYDDEPEYRYDTRSRRLLADHLERELGIPIDRQVTTDSERVIRLPFSLHAGVSRIVTPIQSPDFDFRTQAMPQSIESAQDSHKPSETPSQ